MNQVKIGKFIAMCRKNKNLTQLQLAEKLNITDRAISKWETGKGMPDSGIMLELCNALDISVNELLSGEMIEMNNFDKKAEENLLELKKEQEESTKKMLLLEWVIGFISSITFFIMIFIASFAIENTILRISLITVGLLIFLTGMMFAIKIEKDAGYYECAHCHTRYVPDYKSVLFAMHIGRTRYMKCPKCNRRSWNKKVLTK